jgi:5-methylcytosine-specific restriction enzyme A
MSRLYNHRTWRRYRRAYLQQHPLCAMCAAEGRIRIASQVDLVIALEASGDPWRWDHLEALCTRHYVTKTLITEHGKRLSGVRPDGTPLDPLARDMGSGICDRL